MCAIPQLCFIQAAVGDVDKIVHSCFPRTDCSSVLVCVVVCHVCIAQPHARKRACTHVHMHNTSMYTCTYTHMYIHTRIQAYS